jgi:hypothetical protein
MKSVCRPIPPKSWLTCRSTLRWRRRRSSRPEWEALLTSISRPRTRATAAASAPARRAAATSKGWAGIGYLHNPTDSSKNRILQHLKVSYDKNRIDPICENCVVRHNLSDCVDRPWAGSFCCWNIYFTLRKRTSRGWANSGHAPQTEVWPKLGHFGTETFFSPIPKCRRYRYRYRNVPAIFMHNLA